MWLDVALLLMWIGMWHATAKFFVDFEKNKCGKIVYWMPKICKFCEQTNFTIFFDKILTTFAKKTGGLSHPPPTLFFAYASVNCAAANAHAGRLNATPPPPRLPPARSGGFHGGGDLEENDNSQNGKGV